jgi:hypothetical protein
VLYGIVEFLQIPIMIDDDETRRTGWKMGRNEFFMLFFGFKAEALKLV